MGTIDQNDEEYGCVVVGTDDPGAGYRIYTSIGMIRAMEVLIIQELGPLVVEVKNVYAKIQPCIFVKEEIEPEIVVEWNLFRPYQRIYKVVRKINFVRKCRFGCRDRRLNKRKSFIKTCKANG
jgi:hypothetical protein